MDFQTKINLIDEAREKYITFETEFRQYMASGNSFNGAYNFFSLEDIDRHKVENTRYLELEAWKTLHGQSKDSSPVKLESHSVVTKLEKLDEQLNNASRNKRLPKHKDS